MIRLWFNRLDIWNIFSFYWKEEKTTKETYNSITVLRDYILKFNWKPSFLLLTIPFLNWWLCFHSFLSILFYLFCDFFFNSLFGSIKSIAKFQKLLNRYNFICRIFCRMSCDFLSLTFYFIFFFPFGSTLLNIK